MDENTLQSLLRSMGIDVLPNRAWELLFHLRAVIKANEFLNLTSVVTLDEAVRVHILDSAAACPVLHEAPAGPLADIGSGAGYPGIPLAILSERETTLVESKMRKAAFLRSVASALDHAIDVCPRRAEELALERPGAFAVVSARAVASLPVLVELAAPLLCSGGWFVAYKGKADPEEAQRGEAAARIVGLESREQRPIVVPGLDAQRVLFVFEKTGEPTVRLPRRPGRAGARPLA